MDFTIWQGSWLFHWGTTNTSESVGLSLKLSLIPQMTHPISCYQLSGREHMRWWRKGVTIQYTDFYLILMFFHVEFYFHPQLQLVLIRRSPSLSCLASPEDKSTVFWCRGISTVWFCVKEKDLFLIFSTNLFYVHTQRTMPHREDNISNSWASLKVLLFIDSSTHYPTSRFWSPLFYSISY